MSVASAEPTRRDLRADIMRVATRLFGEQGYSATSMREIVEACGCTKPALYYYFASKEDLFAQAVEHETAAVTAIIEASTTAPGSVRARITSALRAFTERMRADPAALRLLHRVDHEREADMPDTDVAGSRATHMQMMVGLIEQGIASGEIRDDLDAVDVAITLNGAIDFQFRLWFQGHPWDQDRLERTIDILFLGIGGKR